MSDMMALRAHRRGGPSELVFEQAPRPVPGPGEALVEVHAAGITFAELLWNETWFDRNGTDRTPIIPSHEVSGVVVELRGPTHALAVGDEVYGLIEFNRNGAACDYVTMPASHLTRRPRSVSHVEAAAVPLAALTAWQALVDHADIQPGEDVLVRGAAGGVGVFAVQLAAHFGAHVTATARCADLAFVQELGAEWVHDYLDRPLVEVATKFDVIIDAVGGPVPSELYSLSRPGGRLVTLSAPPIATEAQSFQVKAMFFVVQPKPDQLRRLADLVDKGQLRTVIAQTYPLREGRRAYESGREPHGPGKTVLVVR